jgi:hypothetical protein
MPFSLAYAAPIAWIATFPARITPATPLPSDCTRAA